MLEHHAEIPVFDHNTFGVRCAARTSIGVQQVDTTSPKPLSILREVVIGACESTDIDRYLGLITKLWERSGCDEDYVIECLCLAASSAKVFHALLPIYSMILLASPPAYRSKDTERFNIIIDAVMRGGDETLFSVMCRYGRDRWIRNIPLLLRLGWERHVINEDTLLAIKVQRGERYTDIPPGRFYIDVYSREILNCIHIDEVVMQVFFSLGDGGGVYVDADGTTQSRMKLLINIDKWRPCFERVMRGDSPLSLTSPSDEVRRLYIGCIFCLPMDYMNKIKMLKALKLITVDNIEEVLDDLSSLAPVSRGDWIYDMDVSSLDLIHKISIQGVTDTYHPDVEVMEILVGRQSLMHDAELKWPHVTRYRLSIASIDGEWRDVIEKKNERCITYRCGI